MLKVVEEILTSERFAGREAFVEWRIFGVVRSAVRRRCFVVATKAGRGGRRWELGGVRIEAINEGEGVGRPWEVRACVSCCGVTEDI